MRNWPPPGARLVSLNPLRETLEDFFVRQVADATAGEDAGSSGERHERV